MNAPEEWRPVSRYEGLYEVSNLGRIRRLAGSPQCWKTRVLCGGTRNGYLSICLYRDGIGKKFSVHRLVLMAFVGAAPPGTEGTHKDHDRTNARLSNLEYLTHSENEKNKVRAGRSSCPVWGEQNPMAVRPKSTAAILTLRRQGFSYERIRRRLGYRNIHVVRVVILGQHWSQRRQTLGSNAG